MSLCSRHLHCDPEKVVYHIRNADDSESV